MSVNVSIQNVEQQWVAVARDFARPEELPRKVPALIGVAWDFIRSSGIKSDGHNIAIYRGNPTRFPVEAGARVMERFEGTDKVFCSVTPAGRAAMARHVGPYARLGDTHSAVLEFCKSNRHELAGPSWELYGHWDEDPAKVWTDIYYLLR